MCEDVIKVALEGEPQLTDEELQAIVEVAHERGTIVSAHVIYERDLDKALAAGVDDIAHMIRDPLSDEVIDQMIAADVYIVPSMENILCAWSYRAEFGQPAPVYFCGW